MISLASIKKISRRPIIRTSLIFLLGLLLGLGIEWRINVWQEGSLPPSFQKIHPLNNNYSFINPLLGFEITTQKYGQYDTLRNQINNFLQAPEIDSQIKKVAVYFRNLESGETVGINANEEFNPASLLKVPIMIAYYKIAETHPEILTETYEYTDEDVAILNRAFGNDLETKLIKNQAYRVDTLIQEMIIHSDNIAKYLLVIHFPKDDLNNIYSELGIQIHSTSPYTYTISAHAYSFFFRTLYNSTFLNWEMSEKALKLLSQVDYKNGLTTPISGNIKIAHKFGSYARFEDKKVTSVELHDCGIIYYPKHPYLLCVMTRGNDTHELELIIQHISKMAYEFIDKKFAEGS